MLSSEATGIFFRRIDDSIYFGTTALQFAVCSNNEEIFNLVYSCSCSCNQQIVGVKANTITKKKGYSILFTYINMHYMHSRYTYIYILAVIYMLILIHQIYNSFDYF